MQNAMVTCLGTLFVYKVDMRGRALNVDMRELESPAKIDVQCECQAVQAEL